MLEAANGYNIRWLQSLPGRERNSFDLDRATPGQILSVTTGGRFSFSIPR